MQTSFSLALNRLLVASGKSLNQVSSISGIDRPYLLRLSRGDKTNPSYETVIRLFIALCFDAGMIERDPTVVHGLSELLLAAAYTSAPVKLAVG